MARSSSTQSALAAGIAIFALTALIPLVFGFSQQTPPQQPEYLHPYSHYFFEVALPPLSSAPVVPTRSGSFLSFLTRPWRRRQARLDRANAVIDRATLDSEALPTSSDDPKVASTASAVTSSPPAPARLFQMMQDGQERYNRLPALNRPLNLGIGCYYEPSDPMIQYMLFKTRHLVNVVDICWAMEAHDGNIQQVSEAIRLAHYCNPRERRTFVPSTADEDDDSKNASMSHESTIYTTGPETEEARRREEQTLRFYAKLPVEKKWSEFMAHRLKQKRGGGGRSQYYYYGRGTGAMRRRGGSGPVARFFRRYQGESSLLLEIFCLWAAIQFILYVVQNLRVV